MFYCQEVVQSGNVSFKRYKHTYILLLVLIPTGTFNLHVNCWNYTELHKILFTLKYDHSLEIQNCQPPTLIRTCGIYFHFFEFQLGKGNNNFQHTKK